LDDAFQWTSHFSAEKLARGQQLCPLMVQHIESLLEDEKHEVIVTRWAAVISRLEGEAGRKAQAILERTLSSIVERAESLEAQSQYLKAIAEVRSVIALLPGAVRGRADALLARCNAVFVATFERIYEEGRYAIVIAELEPVVATMEQGLAGQARLVLARSYLMHGNPGWAAQHLSEVLKHEPGNIQALLLIAIAYRAKGLLDRASDSYQKVLRLEPENEPAARGYEEVRRQQARPDLEQQQAPLYCPRCGCGSLEAVVTEDIHGLYWLRCTSCRAEFNARDAKHNGHESQSHEPRPQGESQPHDESQSRAPWWMRWRRRWWGSA
jgi:tetratricopeptide (TPR) repeat protein